MMTIGDLIKNKDYDYVEYRISLPEEVGGGDTFFGAFSVENGKIIPKDGDTYDINEEVISHEEWSQNGIPKGLTVVVKRKYSLKGFKRKSFISVIEGGKSNGRKVLCRKGRENTGDIRVME